MSTAGMSGFTKPPAGCLTATLMVLLMVGILVPLALVVWYYGLREMI